jgi:hypothetical protein
MQDLLNRTVCDNAQVRAKIFPNGEAVVGTALAHLTSQPVRMRSLVGGGGGRIWIDINCRLSLDEDEARFLTVKASYCGLSFGEDGEDLLLHYDFEREKDRYTEAHVQVCARHDGFEQYLNRLGRKATGALSKIHLPVGGRRFRPALEDLLECLIAERLVEPKDGWRARLEETRRSYRQRQIAAVVRRNQGTAIRELQRLGYRVDDPGTPKFKQLVQLLTAPRQRDGRDRTTTPR